MQKILILNNDLELGGIQTSLIEFVTYLISSRLCTVDLMLWQKEGPLEKMLPDEVHVIYQSYPITANNVLKEKDTLKKAVMLFQYLRALFYGKFLEKPWRVYPNVSKRYDIAIAYTHNGLPRYFTVDNVVADRKYLWYHHGSYTGSAATKKQDSSYFPQYDRIIAVSTANKLMLVEVFPALKNKLVIVPNILNDRKIISNATASIYDMPENQDGFNFVTVSRFSKEKGLELAIDIAVKLKKKGLVFKWYFIGDGDQWENIQKLAFQKEVTAVCVFLGSRENPYPYIKNADMFIQSSYIEAHPITIIEALILKKMIVATDIPSIKEVLLNGTLGVLCEAQSDVFADNIFRLLQENLMREKLMEAVENYVPDNTAAFGTIDDLMSFGKI